MRSERQGRERGEQETESVQITRACFVVPSREHSDREGEHDECEGDVERDLSTPLPGRPVRPGR